MEEFKVFLPGYPGCPVWVRAQVRECIDPNGSLLPIIEYVVERVYFNTPNDINDPNDPCYSIHQDYVNSGGSITAKVAFVRSLLSQSIDAVALSYFNKWYTFDSVSYLVNPTSPEGLRYLERKCENGQQFFRAIQASCLQSFIRDDCDYPETGIEANGDGKEATAAYDPTFTIIPCRYVRYEPCSVNGPCCIEEIRICRKPSPFIGHDEITEVTKTTQVVGSTGDICEELPGTTVLPGETKTDCYIYCENEPPESFHSTQPNPSGDKVKLSREDLDARK